MDDVCRDYATNICQYGICTRRIDDCLATSFRRKSARKSDGRRGARTARWRASRKLDTARSGLECCYPGGVYASCGVAFQTQD